MYYSQIKEGVRLAKRPPEVLERSQADHWEADLISFKQNSQHLLVLHKRKSRYTATLTLENKTVEHTLKQMSRFLNGLPESLREAVIFDNGIEFYHHWKCKESLGIDRHSCDVYASLQKGTIKNMNGRLHCDLPRKRDLNTLDLKQAIVEHNHIP